MSPQFVELFTSYFEIFRTVFDAHFTLLIFLRLQYLKIPN